MEINDKVRIFRSIDYVINGDNKYFRLDQPKSMNGYAVEIKNAYVKVKLDITIEGETSLYYWAYMNDIS